VNFKKNSNSIVVVFGASGFVGRYIVSNLSNENWKIKVLVRNPINAKHLTLMGKLGQVFIIKGNICNYKDVDKIIKGADKVINLVGILEESSKQKFNNVHFQGSKNIALASAKYKVANLIHISALGLYDGKHSKYAKSKLEAEKSIRKIFKKTVILKPSIIFGEEDNFTNKFAQMATISPFIPLINNGLTKFQPVFVKDVAEAINTVIINNNYFGQTYHLGGPEIINFKEIIDLILLKIDKKRIYVSIPFSFAKLIGLCFSILPYASITLDQVKLLQKDNVVPENVKGFHDLGIKPMSMYVMAEKYLKRYITSY